jgi:hypothetical protein
MNENLDKTGVGWSQRDYKKRVDFNTIISTPFHGLNCVFVNSGVDIVRPFDKQKPGLDRYDRSWMEPKD